MSSSKRSPRAMPIETIITRYKSQKKHDDNKRHKNDTKSKSNTKPKEQYVWKQKQAKSLNEENSIIVLDDDREFYPDKPKRNVESKKIVLKPKFCMKLIGGTKSSNKRKLHMPQKDIKRTRPNTPSSVSSDTDPSSKDHQPTELSIKDMVLLIEEGGGLDDEELLEILTCPSPVWWEDPPNGYMEDPIFSRSKPVEQKSIKSQLLEEQSKEAERRKQREKELKSKDPDNLDVSKLTINVENRGINFVNRRSKLESLLGNIRNKIKSDSDTDKGDKSTTNSLNDRTIEKRVKTDDSNTINISESKPKEVKRNTDKALNTNKKNNSHTNKNQGGLKPRYRKRKVLDSKKASSPKPKVTKNNRKSRRSKRKAAVTKLEFDLKHNDKLEDNRNITTNVETKTTNSVNNTDETNTQYINNLQDHNNHLKKRNKESSSSIETKSTNSLNNSDENNTQDINNLQDHNNHLKKRNKESSSSIETKSSNSLNNTDETNKQYINNLQDHNNHLKKRNKESSSSIETKSSNSLNNSDENNTQYINNLQDHNNHMKKRNKESSSSIETKSSNSVNNSDDNNTQDINNLQDHNNHLKKRNKESSSSIETKSSNSVNNTDDNNTQDINNLQDHNNHLKKRNKESSSSIETKSTDNLNHSDENNTQDINNLQDHNNHLKKRNKESSSSIETKSTDSLNHSDENNTQYINNLQDHNNHLKKRNKESSSSNESLEEDHLIDLEDHELLSLENIEIPIAPKITMSSNKINNTTLSCNSGNKPSCDNQNKVKCTKKEIEKSDEIPKYSDDTSPDKSTHNRVKKIDTTPKPITNKSKVYKSLTNSTCDISLDKIASNNIDNYIKKIRASKKRSLIKRNKNDGLKNTSSIKVKVIPSSFIKDNVRQNVKSDMSHFLSDIIKVCNVKNKDTTVILKETKDTESCINNRKRNKNDLCTKVVDETSRDKANKFANESDDLNKNLNNSIPNKNIISYNISENDSTFKKICDNYGKGNKIATISETKGEIDNARRYSIDSAFSDKNMSIEYLDMSLLDEDEHKVEPLSNEVRSECDDKPQDEKQGINENSQIDFRSDPELYDQVNESDNNDIIQYIRKNNKDIDKEIVDNESFNAGCTMSGNFRSSSPIQQTRKTPNVWTPEKENLGNKQQPEYVAVYKIINSDSDIESNLSKTYKVKADDNYDDSIKINKTEDSYDEEYLSEFYEEDSEGNTDKINEVKGTAVNIDNEVNLMNVKLNKVDKISVKNPEYLMKSNEVADTASQCNEGILVNPDASKINNYFQHRKQVRKTPCDEGKLGQVKKINCKSCNLENKSILISTNDTIKYCLVCSSIYDTDKCKYCIKKIKCSCKTVAEYICDKCSVKLSDRKSIIDHLNVCNVGG